MIPALTTILAFQLAGEITSRALALPLPGPVIGMLALVAAMSLSPRVGAMVRPTAQGLLAHLSLYFVPAGAGLVANLATLSANGVAIALALVVSTVLAIAAGALTFTAVLRLTGGASDV